MPKKIEEFREPPKRKRRPRKSSKPEKQDNLYSGSLSSIIKAHTKDL